MRYMKDYMNMITEGMKLEWEFCKKHPVGSILWILVGVGLVFSPIIWDHVESKKVTEKE